MHELNQYKELYYNPSRDYEFNYKVDRSHGVRYHDNFFNNYYKFLHEREENEGFFNKFGKRY